MVKLALHELGSCRTRVEHICELKNGNEPKIRRCDRHDLGLKREAQQRRVDGVRTLIQQSHHEWLVRLELLPLYVHVFHGLKCEPHYIGCIDRAGRMNGEAGITTDGEPGATGNRPCSVPPFCELCRQPGCTTSASVETNGLCSDTGFMVRCLLLGGLCGLAFKRHTYASFL